MFVHAPVTMTVSRPSPLSKLSSLVPSHAFMRIFSTTKSPSSGSSPFAGAAPHEPLTSPPVSLTPWKSPALSFRPGAPSSTMYQTWSTGMPLLRHVSARRFTFSTTFCSFACSGAPVSAQAPPSIITSFCRSWMISAQRAGSRVNASSFIFVLLAHVRLAARADLRPDRVQGCRARDEERVPVVAAPGDIARVLRDLHHAEVLAGGGDDPDPAGAGHPDVAALVALHPVGDALLDHA